MALYKSRIIIIIIINLWFGPITVHILFLLVSV